MYNKATCAADVKYAIEMNESILIKREDLDFVRQTLHGYDIKSEDYCGHVKLSLGSINDHTDIIYRQLEAPLA